MAGGGEESFRNESKFTFLSRKENLFKYDYERSAIYFIKVTYVPVLNLNKTQEFWYSSDYSHPWHMEAINEF